MKIPKIITLDYLDKLDKGEIVGKNGRCGFPYLGADVMIKRLFVYNKEFTKNFILNVCHIDELNPRYCRIKFLNTEQFDPSVSSKKTVTDFVVKINDKILLNIESNRESFESVKQRNDYYISRVKTSELKIGEKYKVLKEQKFIQLNLNFNESESVIGEDIIYSYSIKTNTIFLPNNPIYIRNLDYYRDIYYNQDIEKSVSDYYLACLTAKTFKEFYEMLGHILNDNARDRLVRNVINFAMDNLFTEEELKALDKIVEHDLEVYYEKKYKEEIDAAREKGIEQGVEENKLEIAKSMLLSNENKDKIIKYTGLSKEKIEELSKEINR